jgi:hypothetical protein
VGFASLKVKAEVPRVSEARLSGSCAWFPSMLRCGTASHHKHNLRAVYEKDQLVRSFRRNEVVEIRRRVAS